MHYTPSKFGQIRFCSLMFESFDLLPISLVPFGIWPSRPKNISP